MDVTTIQNIQDVDSSSDIYDDDFEEFSTQNISNDVVLSFSPVQNETSKNKPITYYQSIQKDLTSQILALQNFIRQNDPNANGDMGQENSGSEKIENNKRRNWNPRENAYHKEIELLKQKLDQTDSPEYSAKLCKSIEAQENLLQRRNREAAILQRHQNQQEKKISLLQDKQLTKKLSSHIEQIQQGLMNHTKYLNTQEERQKRNEKESLELDVKLLELQAAYKDAVSTLKRFKPQLQNERRQESIHEQVTQLERRFNLCTQQSKQIRDQIGFVEQSIRRGDQYRKSLLVELKEQISRKSAEIKQINEEIAYLLSEVHASGSNQLFNHVGRIKANLSLSSERINPQKSRRNAKRMKVHNSFATSSSPQLRRPTKPQGLDNRLYKRNEGESGRKHAVRQYLEQAKETQKNTRLPPRLLNPNRNDKTKNCEDHPPIASPDSSEMSFSITPTPVPSNNPEDVPLESIENHRECEGQKRQQRDSIEPEELPESQEDQIFTVFSKRSFSSFGKCLKKRNNSIAVAAEVRTPAKKKIHKQNRSLCKSPSEGQIFKFRSKKKIGVGSNRILKDIKEKN